MHITNATLAFRRRGDTEWVHIDPLSPTGRRLMKSIGLYPLEDEMTAATAATTTPHAPGLRVVADSTAGLSWFARARKTVGGVAGKAMSPVRKALGWVADKLHLRAAGDFIGGIFGWAKSKAAGAIAFLGVPGIVGLGLLALSTGAGRSAIVTGFRPVRWAFKMIDNGYCWAADKIGNLGRPGEFVAERMMDIEEFFAGNSTKPGMIARGVDAYNTWAAPFLRTNGLIAYIARLAGTALLIPKAILLVALLPLGFATMPLQYLVGAGMGAYALWTAFVSGVGLFNLGRALVSGRDAEGKFTSVRAEATADAAEAVTDGHAPAAPVAKKVQSSTGSANRATRRAQQRAGRAAAATA